MRTLALLSVQKFVVDRPFLPSDPLTVARCSSQAEHTNFVRLLRGSLASIIAVVSVVRLLYCDSPASIAKPELCQQLV